MADAEVGRIMTEFEARGKQLSDVRSQLGEALEKGRRYLELVGGAEAAALLEAMPSNPVPPDMAPEALRKLLGILQAQVEVERQKVAKLQEAAAAGIDPKKMQELVNKEVEKARAPLLSKIDAIQTMRDQQEVELVMLREELRDMMRNGSDLDEAREARFAVQRLKRVQDTLEKSGAANSKRLEGMLESARAEAECANEMFREATQKLDKTTDALHDAEERESRMRREMVAATYSQLKQLRSEMTAAHSSRLRELAHLIFLRDKQLEAALYGGWPTEADAAAAAQHNETFWVNEGLSPPPSAGGGRGKAGGPPGPKPGGSSQTGVTHINNMIRGFEPKPRPSTGTSRPQQRLARVKSASVDRLPSFGTSQPRATAHLEMRSRGQMPEPWPHPITGKVPARRGTLDLRPVAVQDMADDSHMLISASKVAGLLPGGGSHLQTGTTGRPRVQSAAATLHGSPGSRKGDVSAAPGHARLTRRAQQVRDPQATSVGLERFAGRAYG